MQMSVRQTDMVGRMGGDEFALILPDTSKAAANTVLRKVSRMLERGMKQNGWRITFSIGAVTFLAPPVSVQEMIAGADQAMFAVKNSGKRSAGLLQPKCRYSTWIATSHSEISLCYNARLRTHLDLEKDAPIPPSVQPPSIGRVIEMPQGGRGARLCLVAGGAVWEVEWTSPRYKITRSSSKPLMRYATQRMRQR